LPGNASTSASGHTGRTLAAEIADHTFRAYDGDELLTEVARTTTKPIARFKVREPNRRGTWRDPDQLRNTIATLLSGDFHQE
jgi:hypothetical protein